MLVYKLDADKVAISGTFLKYGVSPHSSIFYSDSTLAKIYSVIKEYSEKNIINLYLSPVIEWTDISAPDEKFVIGRLTNLSLDTTSYVSKLDAEFELLKTERASFFESMLDDKILNNGRIVPFLISEFTSSSFGVKKILENAEIIFKYFELFLE